MSDDFLILAFALLPALLGIWGSRSREILLHKGWMSLPLGWALLGSLVWLGRSGRLGPVVIPEPGRFFAIDPISSLVVSLVLFLSVVLFRYSCRHLEDHPRQKFFLKQMGWTLFGVVLLVSAQSLFLYLIAWVFVSFFLDRLLRITGDSESALGAQQKFWVSRMGDGFLVAAACLLYLEVGSTQFDLMMSFATDRAHVQTGVALLLVLGALSKSAQFPFQYWLPNTMNTPVPVSAIMHAGIINSGGVLLLKSAALLQSQPLVQMILIGLAMVSLILAMLTMLVQTDVKRALAYSTIGQMGFMFLQIGLGAYGFALIHILGHGLYKAHAFLSSGNTLLSRPVLQSLQQRPPLSPMRRFLVGGITLLALLLPILIAKVSLPIGLSPAKLVFVVVLGLAIAQIVITSQSLWHWTRVALSLVAGYIALFMAMQFFAQDFFPINDSISGWFAGVLIVSFVALFILNNSLSSLAQTRWGQWLYVQLFVGERLGKLHGRPHVL